MQILEESRYLKTYMLGMRLNFKMKCLYVVIPESKYGLSRKSYWSWFLL